jgi:hypothetical protein
MSNEYTPDLWVIVDVNSEHGKIRKILGSWYGGFAGSNSWRMSSGITEVIEHDNHYEIHNHSGSVYTCYKNSIGMSSYTSSVFNNYMKEMNKIDATMEIVDISSLPLKAKVS